MARILIPEGLARNVLAAVRALGRAGHTITIASYSSDSKTEPIKSSLSRYVSSEVRIHSPHIDPDAYVSDLVSILLHDEHDVLLPFTHGAVLPISLHLEELSALAAIPFPTYKVLSQAHDKLETARLAYRLGIHIPVTWEVRNESELIALKDELVYPSLVKARQGCGIGKTIRFAKNFDELLRGYREITLQSSTPPINDFQHLIIQEYIPGQIHDGLFLYEDGLCRLAVSQERVVTYPAQGGTGAVNRTTDNPMILDIGRRLLNELGWHGPAQVEVKFDPRDGKYKLLEINPKFWGTLACSMAAGVNFPEMAVQMALGKVNHWQEDYMVGWAYTWFFPDTIYSLFRQFSWHNLFAALGKDSRKVRFDWDWQDPMPDIWRVRRTFGTLLRNRKMILSSSDELNQLALQKLPAIQKESSLY